MSHVNGQSAEVRTESIGVHPSCHWESFPSVTLPMAAASSRSGERGEPTNLQTDRPLISALLRVTSASVDYLT